MSSFFLAFVCLASSGELSRSNPSGSVPKRQSKVGAGRSRLSRHEDGMPKSNLLMSFVAFFLAVSPSPVTAFTPPTRSPHMNLPTGLPIRSESYTPGSDERRHPEMVVAVDVMVEDEETVRSGKTRSILKLRVKPKSPTRQRKRERVSQVEAEAEEEEQREQHNKQLAQEAMQRALRAMEEERERLREKKKTMQREREERERLEKERLEKEAVEKAQLERRKDRTNEEDEERPELYVMSPLDCENMIDKLLDKFGPGSMFNGKYQLDENQTQACIHGLKMEAALEKRRKQLDQLHKKAQNRKLSDAQFAKALNMTGGKKGFHREMLRLKLVKKIFLNGFQGLKRWTANMYSFSNVGMQDLVLAGDRGLLEAALFHDPSCGFSFVGAAVRTMKRHMYAEITRCSSTVRLPNNLQKDFVRSRIIERELKHAGFEADMSKVADAMERTNSRLEQVHLKMKETRTSSLNAPIKERKPSRFIGQARLPNEFTEQQELPGIDEYTAAELMQSDADKIMAEILSPRERLILSQRFGLDDAGEEGKISLAETAVGLGLSSGQVQRIERVALMKMNHYFSS